MGACMFYFRGELGWGPIGTHLPRTPTYPSPPHTLAALGATGPDVSKHVTVLGIVALLAKAAWRTLLGRLRLGPKYTL